MSEEEITSTSEELMKKAQKCRRLARGLDERTSIALIKLAEDYERQAAALGSDVA